MSPDKALKAALAYARLGMFVLPLRRRAKEPVCPNGFYDATNDEAEVERIWKRWPGANIGIRCDESSVLVIDCDKRAQGDETIEDLEARLGPLPHTPTVLTPGGSHRYFVLPKDRVFVGSAGPGVDVKVLGYVVVPPSVHPSGKPYVWELSSRLGDVALAELPTAWVEALTKKDRSGARVASSGIDARESYLGFCFERLGWLGNVLADGRRMAQCPWVAEHSDARGDGHDTSCVLFPRAVERTLGGFRCLHGHCASRTWRDVLDVIPPHIRAQAARVTQRLQSATNEVAHV